MALDPQLRALLEGGLALPSLAEASPAEARARHREAALSARGPDFAPEPVGAVEHLRIDGPGGELELRRYTPREGGGGPDRAGDGRAGGADLPVVVYLHGGGWVLGDLDVQDPTCRHLANATGAEVVAVAYRLAPEHPFPAALDDVCATLRWAHDRAPAGVAVAGSSAGANLAAAAALRTRDEGGPPLRAQLLLYPPTDPTLGSPSVAENADGYYLTAEDMRNFVDAYLPDSAARTDPYAGPLHAPSLEGLPPAVVTTAGFDPLRDEGVAYAERLRDAGVAVTHLHYPELIHGYFAFADQAPAAARARGEVLTAFARALGER